jgi:hypothetical protein
MLSGSKYEMRGFCWWWSATTSFCYDLPFLRVEKVVSERAADMSEKAHSTVNGIHGSSRTHSTVNGIHPGSRTGSMLLKDLDDYFVRIICARNVLTLSIDPPR